jgi:meiotic recombination protein SPO11
MQSAASKGVFAGPVRLFCRDGSVVYGETRMDHGDRDGGGGAEWGGSLIPPGEQVVRVQVDEDVTDVVVIEKHAVFHTLLQGRFEADAPLRRAILITVRHNISLFIRREIEPRDRIAGHGMQGKGYPDIATRELVARLAAELPR